MLMKMFCLLRSSLCERAREYFWFEIERLVRGLHEIVEVFNVWLSRPSKLTKAIVTCNVNANCLSSQHLAKYKQQSNSFIIIIQHGTGQYAACDESGLAGVGSSRTPLNVRAEAACFRA